jgi:sugar phosphate isomerase/epimerase
VLIGLMNHATLPLDEELAAIAAAGYEFIDLTLEPPAAWPADGAEIGNLLKDLGLAAVGHTPPFLAHASPFPVTRAAVHAEFRRLFEEFAAAGVKLVNVHPDPVGAATHDEAIRANADSLAALTVEARAAGVTLMLENFGRQFSTPEELAPLFAAAPELNFHLDVGHANMGRTHGAGNRTASLLGAFGNRLAHVHVHDNRGDDDLHLPLGLGTVPWADVIAELKGVGYDGTVTIEVFGDREYCDLSRERWQRWWTGER